MTFEKHGIKNSEINKKNNMKKIITTGIIAFIIQNSANAVVVAHSSAHISSHAAARTAATAAVINNRQNQNQTNNIVAKVDTFSECYYSTTYYRNVAKNLCNIEYWSDSSSFNGIDLRFGSLENRNGKFSNLSGVELKKQQILCFRSYCNL